MTLAKIAGTPIPEEEKVYEALIRSLRRRKGFGILFVECSPTEANELIPRITTDLPQKTIETLKLNAPIENLYDLVASHANRNQINILFIQGLEKSLESDIKPGYGGEGLYYNLNTIPKILNHLNQQRERFRDHFSNICFVFFLPSFAVKYFIRRAPDFFDWRSGAFDLAAKERITAQKSTQKAQRHGLKKYINCNQQDLIQILLEHEASLKKIESNSQEKVKLLLQKGEILYLLNRYEASFECFNKVIEINPENYTAWNSRGLVLLTARSSKDDLFTEGNLTGRAVKSFNRAVQLNPGYTTAWYNLGIGLTRLGRYEEAVESYSRAIELDSNSSEYWHNKAIALFLLGRYEEAMVSGDRALQLKPDDSKIWTLEGLIAESLNQKEEAGYLYKRAAKIAPNDSTAWYNLGKILSELGRHNEAIQSYSQVLNLEPNHHKAIAKRGWQLRQIHQYDRAIEDLNNSIGICPNYAWAVAARGRFYREVGKYDRSLQDLNLAIALNPEYVWAIAQRGQTYRLMQNYEKALENFDQAIELFPNYRWAIRRRGEVYGLARRYEKALADLNYALDLNPSSNWTLYWRSIIYRTTGRKEDARDDLYKAIRLAQLSYERNPYELDNVLNLALYHVAVNDMKTANTFYQEALSSEDILHYLPGAKQKLEELLRFFPASRFSRISLKCLQRRLTLGELNAKPGRV